MAFVYFINKPLCVVKNDICKQWQRYVDIPQSHTRQPVYRHSHDREQCSRSQSDEKM